MRFAAARLLAAQARRVLVGTVQITINHITESWR
jgi:hypothetical protein